MEYVKCANPYCSNVFRRYTKCYTTSGIQRYCSRACASAFTVGMLRVVEDLELDDGRELREEIKSLGTMCMNRAEICRFLGITSHTLNKWAVKLNLQWKDGQFVDIESKDS